MAFIHFAGCPVWGDEHMVCRCTCPREWRIRKDPDRPPCGQRERRYPWVISHRDDSGDYRPVMYTDTFAIAVEAVVEIMTLIRVTDRKHRRPAVSGGQVG